MAQLQSVKYPVNYTVDDQAAFVTIDNAVVEWRNLAETTRNETRDPSYDDSTTLAKARTIYGEDKIGRWMEQGRLDVWDEDGVQMVLKRQCRILGTIDMVRSLITAVDDGTPAPETDLDSLIDTAEVETDND